MDRSMRLVSAALVLALLLVATEMGPMAAEGRIAKVVESKKRTCESQSKKFKGICFLTSYCATSCETEGFNGGQCRGFRRTCFCSKAC
ncbi:defensin-like protein 1 [Prunus yedoensis var. nudiflora]|uniref:Defensin-like protein 1 n=1 Tax=Prunus yedoensis var. nudiflora TaxID=2094558 RepID=A0A314XLN5_PRUYE|nr:defensin-like protein 1 [Prunus yedoensis var. nudiflora]